MNRLGLLRKVSEEGYKLLRIVGSILSHLLIFPDPSQDTNHAVYSYENDRTLLCMRGETIELTDDELDDYSLKRGLLNEEGRNIMRTLNDLVHDSLG